MEIRRILCPTDFSDCSGRAFAHAVAIAQWHDATITLFHVWARPHGVSGVRQPFAVGWENEDAAVAAMKQFAETEVGTTVPLQFDIGEGSVAAQIVANAAAMPADLIVLGTHGRSGFDRLVLGSVTEKVLRKAGCPVLTVPPRSADAVPLPSALFTHVLCAIDFSDASMRALEQAVSIAQQADAHLTVLHVLELPEAIPHGRAPGPGHTVQSYLAAIEADRRTSLAHTVPKYTETYGHVDTMLLTGTPWRTIVRIAAEQRSHMIVIGTHGRGAADLLTFGSTAQQVVRHATCPVLTFRTGDA